MMLQSLSFVDNGQSVVLQALAGPLLKFPAPLTSPTKNDLSTNCPFDGVSR